MSRVLALLNFKVLGFAIVTMAIVLGVAVSQLFETRRFIEMLSDSYERSLDFRITRAFLVDLETGQRGFLLTGQEVLLEPAVISMARLPLHLDKLDELTEGFPNQRQRALRLREIAVAKQEQALGQIEARRRLGLEGVLPMLQGEGKKLTDQARELVEEALEEEAGSQAKMKERQRRGLWVTTFLIIVSGLLCLAAGVNALMLFRKAMRASRIQRRAMIQRRRAISADREKSRFMANMSHEIRTPMNAIIGFSQLLQGEVQSARARHYVNAIGTAGENLLGLINDVLDLSKIEAGRVDLKPEVIDIREVVKNLNLLLSQRAYERGLQFETRVDDAVPAWLLLDPLRLRQMLMNLLSNAIKFTKEGRVSLQVGCESTAGITDSVALWMEVTDTGCGIHPADIELIFKPFRQGKQREGDIEEGTGLGLSITRRLANLMGGKVTAKSVTGEGSTFRLELPKVPVAQAGPESMETSEETVTLDDLPAMKVLVVDDNAHNREVMGAFFLGTHHRIQFATNGLEAVELAVRDTPDLILMDIRMPRLDGREATELIRRHETLVHTPVIAVTASSLTDTQGSTRASFNGYLRKPFLRPQLVRVIRDAVADASPDEPDAATGSATPPNPLPEEAAARLRALLDDPWPALKRSMGVRAVRDFAEQVSRLANSQNSPSLRDFAANLSQEVATYQISRMERSLDAFPALVEMLAPPPPKPTL